MPHLGLPISKYALIILNMLPTIIEIIGIFSSPNASSAQLIILSGIKMKIITKENFHNEVEGFDGLSVIDLYADWCGPCRMLAPILTELEGEYPDINF